MKIFLNNKEIEGLRNLVAAYGYPEEETKEPIINSSDKVSTVTVDENKNVSYDMNEDFCIECIELLIKMSSIVIPIVQAVKSAVDFFKIDMRGAFRQFENKWFSEDKPVVPNDFHPETTATGEIIVNDEKSVNDACKTVAQ
jgi:hypothetical protein